jgi:hypothetical protein
MTEKKLSRRDAMKILGAAIGAAALANLPSKWDKPELAQGVLPAHARQSAGFFCYPSETVDAATWNGNNYFAGQGRIHQGTTVSYTVTITGAGTIGGSAGPFVGSVVADAAGDAFVDLGVSAGFVAGSVVTEVDTFSNGQPPCTYTATII